MVQLLPAYETLKQSYQVLSTGFVSAVSTAVSPCVAQSRDCADVY